MTQPRGNRKTVKIVLIVIIVLVLVCCCGGSVGAYLLLDGTTKAPKAATTAFLEEVEAGNLTAAYDRLCESTKSRFEQPSFEKALNDRKITGHDLHWGGSYDNSNGLETATIHADLTYADGSKDSHAFPLRKESGTWKICGSPY